MKVKGILFDFDFTLADSSAGIIKCVKHALSGMNYGIPDDYSIKRTIGIKLDEAFMVLTGSSNINDAGKFKKLFIEEADSVMSINTFIYERVLGTVEYLKNKNLKTGIVSTKFRYRINDIFRSQNFKAVFDVIIGGEDVASQKPHPEGLLKALKFLALSPEEALYVGDSLTDQSTCENAKVKFIAALTGCTKKEEFDESLVYKFINNLDDLKKLV